MTRMGLLKKTGISLFLCFLMVAGAQARDDDGVRARAWGGTVLKADLDGHSGGYGVVNSGVSLGWRWFTLTYNNNHYSWNNVDRLPLGDKRSDPWDSLNNLDFDATFDGNFTGNLGWFAGANVYSGWEKDISDSFGAGGRLGISYKLGQNWRLRLGAFLLYHPIGVQGWPIVGLSWQPPGSEKQGLSFSIGSPATMVQYRFTPVVALRAGAHYQYGVYRLANDSAVYEQGYVMPRSVVAGLYVDVTPLQGLSLVAGVEGNLWRDIALYDDDGDKVEDWDVDSAMGFVLRLNYGF